MDLTEAAYLHLAAHPEIQNLVLGGYVGTDAASDATDVEKLTAAWLFRVQDDEGRPFRDVEGTGTSAIVVSSRNDWSGKNPHNTASFPRLQVLIYADTTRQAEGTHQSYDAIAKCKHIAKRVDLCFHRPDRSDDMWWGTAGDRTDPMHGVWVHSSLNSSPLDIRDVPNTHSLTVRGELTYEVITD
jgi:hypothetical protein